MKKFRFVLALVAFAGVTLVSCDNDDDNSASASLEGKWTPTKTIAVLNGNQTVTNYDQNEAGCDKDYREFASGGIFRYVILYRNASDVCTEDIVPSTWTKNGDIVTINDTDPSSTVSPPNAGTYEITKLTNTELRLKSTANAGQVDLEVTEVFRRL